MPEIKNTFMSGKMNKDLDERLVQKNEYRDALNIEVSTSKGSDVGALQNTYGNTSKSSVSPYIGKSKCVGSIVDNANDKIYWFVYGQREEIIKNGNFNDGQADPNGLTNWNGFDKENVTVDTVNGNLTLGKDGTQVNTTPFIQQKEILEVGKEYTLTFDVTSINTSASNSTGTHKELFIRKTVNGVFTYPTIPNSNAVGSVSYTFTAGDTDLLIGINSSHGSSPSQFYWDETTIDRVSIKKKNVNCIAEYDFKTEETEPVLVDASTDEESAFLKFNGNQITGINILDGMLFWTDGENEPKKISIDHFKGGSNKNITGSQDEKLNWTTTTKQRSYNNEVIGDVLEKHITVIKKYPLNAPSISLSDTVHGEPNINAKSKSICVHPANTTYSYNRSHLYGSAGLEMNNQPVFAKIKRRAGWANAYTAFKGYKPNHSLYLDGSNQYAQFDKSIVVGNTFTFACWVKFDELGSSNRAIIGRNNSGGGNQLIIGAYSQPNHAWHVNLNDQGVSADSNNFPIEEKKWYHVVATFKEVSSTTEVKLYIEGVLAIDTTLNVTLDENASTDKNWTIGAEYDGGSSLSDYLKGNIDDLALWNTDLPESACLALRKSKYHFDVTQDDGGSYVNFTNNLIVFYDFDDGFNSTEAGSAVGGDNTKATLYNGASLMKKNPRNSDGYWSRSYEIHLDVTNVTPWANPKDSGQGTRYPLHGSWSTDPNIWQKAMDIRDLPGAADNGYKKFRSLMNGSRGYYNVYALTPNAFGNASSDYYVKFIGTTHYMSEQGVVTVHPWRDEYFEDGNAYIPQEGDILMFFVWDSFNNTSFWTYKHEETNEIVPKPPGTSNTPKLDKQGRWLRDYVGDVPWIFPKLETETQQGLFHFQSRAQDFGPGWVGVEAGYEHTKDASYTASDYRYVDNIVYNLNEVNGAGKGTHVTIRATVEIIDIDASVYIPGTTNVYPVGFGDPTNSGRNNGLSTYQRAPKSSGVGTYIVGTYFNDQSDLPDNINNTASSYYNGQNMIPIFCHKGVTARISNISIQYYGARPVRIQDLSFSPKPNFAEGDIVKLTNQTDSAVQIQVKLKKEKTGLEYAGSTYGYSAPLDLNSGYSRGANMIHADAALPGPGALSTPNNCYLYWSAEKKEYTDLTTSGSDRLVWSIPQSTNSTNGYLYANYYTQHQAGWVAYNEDGNDTNFQIEGLKTYELEYTITSSDGDNETKHGKLYLSAIHGTHVGDGYYNLLLPSTVGTHRVFFTARKSSTSFRIYCDRGTIVDSQGNLSTAGSNSGQTLNGDDNAFFRGHISNLKLYPITVNQSDYGNYGSNEERSTFECEILSISDDIVKLDNETARYWDAELTELESIYKFRFPRFAYRWRYADGEYSAMSPFTEVAFLPGDEYEFDAIDSYNKSMLNTVRRITLGNFETKPSRVKQLDILVKDSDSTNIYKFASIRGDELTNLTDYVITSEQYEGLLESSQLLRHFDNVPKKAKAQEISSNRLIYGNYTQQYNILDNELPQVSASLSSRYIDPKQTNKSIKSIRNYQVGISYIDQYGRQTPVFSTPNGVVKIQKENSLTANTIVANVNGDTPDWATHVKYYVKDAATEYYNLSLDRHYYDDDDEHIWMSFASSDFDKVERDDYIILKKEHDGDKSIVDKSRYKILAKEGSAPDFVKFVKRQLGERVYAENGQSLQFTATAVGFPQVGKTTFRIAGNDVHNHSFLAQPDIEGVEPRGALMDDQTGRFIKIGKEDNNEVVSMTSFYEILSVSRVNESASSTDVDFSDAEDYYEFTLIEPFGADVGFVGNHNDSNPENKGLFLEYYEESDRVDSDAFEGRFFVKIKKDAEILKRISDKNQSAASTNTLVTAAANVFWAHTFDKNIRSLSAYTGSATEDGKDGDFTLRNKSLFYWKSNVNDTLNEGVYNGVNARHNSSLNSVSPNTHYSFFYQAIFGHDGWISDPDGNDWDGRIYDLNPVDPSASHRLIANPYFGDYDAGTSHWTQTGADYYKPATGGTWKRSHWRCDDYQEGNQKFCIDQAWAFGWPEYQKLYDGQDLNVENNALGTGFVIGNDYCCFRVANIGNQTNLDSVTVSGTLSGDVLYARGANTFDDFSLTSEFFNDIKVVKALTTTGTKFRWSNDPTNTIYTVKKVVATGKVKNYHNVEQVLNFGDLVDWNTAQAYQTADHSAAINGKFVADYGLSYHPASSMQWGMHSRSNQGYRIALMLDKDIVWSPTSSSYGGGQTPLKRLDELESDTANHLAYASLEIISSGASGDGGYSTDNPAIFEVEPIDNTDFNLYYEASNTSMILKTGMSVEALNNENINDGGGNYLGVSDVGTPYAPGGTVLLANAKIVVDRPGEFYIDNNTWDPNSGQLPAGITLRVSKKDANGIIEYHEDFITKTGISNSIGDNLIDNDEFTLGVNGLQDYELSSGLTADNSAGNGVIIETGTNTSTYPFLRTGPIPLISGEAYQVDIDVEEINNDVFDSVSGEHTIKYFLIGSENGSYRPLKTETLKQGLNTRLFVFDQSQNEDSNGNPVSSGYLFVAELVNIKGTYKRVHIKSVSVRLMGDTVDVSDRPVRWHNCYTFGNGVESDRLRDDFNAVKIDKGPKVSTTLDEPYEEENRKNGLIYSGLYNSKTGFNKLNEFIMADKITKDVNPEYGSLQKLFSRNTDLVAFCEDKVLRILSNKDALYNADGNPQVVASNAVLGQAVPFSGDYGISKNPESFASFGYRAYFTDKARGSVLRLSMDGLTEISAAGMSRYFKDNLHEAETLIGSYDQDKDLYNLTINKKQNYDDKGDTISFAESTVGWTSFKSFLPESAVSLNGVYYTFKNGDIWKHNDNEIRNNFYGVQYESSVKFLFNDAPSVVKDFKTLGYEGSNGWRATSIETDMDSGQVVEFKDKEGKKFANIIGVEVDETNISLNSKSTQGLGLLSSITMGGYGKFYPLVISGVINNINAKFTLNTSATEAQSITSSITNNYEEGTTVGVSQEVTHEFYIHPKTINGLNYAVAASNFTVTSSDNNRVSVVAATDTGTPGDKENKIKITLKVEYNSNNLFPSSEQAITITVDGSTTLAIN